MKMISKHGNVIMEVVSKSEQERKRGLGYTEYKEKTPKTKPQVDKTDSEDKPARKPEAKKSKT